MTSKTVSCIKHYGPVCQCPDCLLEDVSKALLERIAELEEDVLQLQTERANCGKRCLKLEEENQRLREALTVIDDYFDRYIGHIPYNVAVAAKTAQGVDDGL